MSQINDALKRAKKMQQPDSPSGVTPLPPVASASRTGIGWLLPAVVVLFIATACTFVVLAFVPQKPRPHVTATVPATQTIPSTPALPKTPPPPPPVPQTNTVTVPVTAPPKPAPPALKLLGISYNANKPQAIVNGATVYVGDTVNGFRVKLISPNSVSFITPDGTEKTLKLGE